MGLRSPDGSKIDRALDRQELVRVALELLDDVGLEGLTMRTLADRLGVKASSLYWHLRDKEELIDLMVEAINAEIPDADADLPWRRRLEDQGWAWRQVLLSHRDAARLAMGRVVAGPQTLGRIEAVLQALKEAGLEGADAGGAAYLLANFVPGFVAEETSRRPAAAAPIEATLIGDLKRAQLEVAQGTDISISANQSIPDLYRVYSEGRPPKVRLEGATVRLERARGRRNGCEIELSGRIPWQVTLAGGASKLRADLRLLQLEGFEVTGGVSSVDLKLPAPMGTVLIRVGGGASRLSILRPPGVPVQVNGAGAVSKVSLDGQMVKSAGELNTKSRGYDAAPGRYEISVAGGMSNVTVGVALSAEAEVRATQAAAADAGNPFASLPEAEYPNLTRWQDVLVDQSMDDRFRFGLQVLLDGLEQRLHRKGGGGP